MAGHGRTKNQAENVGVRLPANIIERLDALLPRLELDPLVAGANPGAPTRATAIRLAIFTGLASLEERLPALPAAPLAGVLLHGVTPCDDHGRGGCGCTTRITRGPEGAFVAVECTRCGERSVMRPEVARTLEERPPAALIPLEVPR